MCMFQHHGNDVGTHSRFCPQLRVSSGMVLVALVSVHVAVACNGVGASVYCSSLRYFRAVELKIMLDPTANDVSMFSSKIVTFFGRSDSYVG